MLYLSLIILSSLLIAISLFATWRVTRRGGTDGQHPEPPITVLKPLCGADDALESNLETFFLQQYPNFELLFGVEGPDDPAIAVVDRLRRRYPEVKSRLVQHRGGRGLNPKVSNLRAMLEAGTHDLLLISDSNVAAPADYLRELAATMAGDPRIGLVSNLFCGEGERTIGATLENLQLNGIAGTVATTSEFSERTIVIGKSMFFRRSDLNTLGGMESVASVLAEDYIIGRMFRGAGFRVVLSRRVIVNLCRHTSVRQFMSRQLRWAMLRWRLQPLVYLLEPISYPIGLAAVAPLFGVGALLPLLWAVAATVLRDGIQWTLLRGRAGRNEALPLGIFKDLLMLIVWVWAPFRRHVCWRGNRLRVSAGTRLYAEARTISASQLWARG